ncbi:hypothetical protein [Almyronema epifaneia]|uniref:Uncharacterized protein n=1 Tax=Almyronema epifaneia S1 TaxID=2991925 RepID=A0ABW6IAC4_9CYAN
MQYFYCFANASLTLRIIHYLFKQPGIRLACVTVIYLVDCWVMRIQLETPLEPVTRLDFEAFLKENGLPYQPSFHESMALKRLDIGGSPTEVMNRYHLVIVSHGIPQPEELEAFRQRFIEGLGYCPQNLA